VKINTLSSSRRTAKSHGRVAEATFVLVAMLLGAALVPSNAMAQAGQAFVLGRVLVEPRAGVSKAAFQATLTANGGRSVGTLRALNTHIVQLAPGLSETAVAAKLSNHPNVKFAEVDAYVAPAGTVNDPLFANQWHLAKIGAPTAWDMDTGVGVTIAILDTGVNAHPDLVPNLVAGWSAFDNTTNTQDLYGHGTGVAGAAAAEGNNALGVASVAYNAKIMPIRISDSTGVTSYSVVANALTWAADRGARVANISYSDMYKSSTVTNAANYFRSKGGSVVVAAGNNGIDEGYGASDAFVVTSATDANDTIASWSSYGSMIDIAAPGVSVLTTSPSGSYEYWSGTSLSTPVVSGVLAMIYAAHPTYTPSQAESILFSTAVDLGVAGKDNRYGYGRVDARAALAAVGTPTPTDTTAPTVAIAAPTGGTVSGTLAVNVNASDNVGVTRVDLLVNGQVVASDASAPYAFSWNSASVPDGSATLSAKAVDAAGNSATSAAVTLNVANNVADTTAPTVTFASPANGAKVGNGNVTVSVTAYDNRGVVSLILAIDGKTIATTNLTSLSYKWNTRSIAKGTHSLVATARDAAGNVRTSSISVTK
jgi:thermitase